MSSFPRNAIRRLFLDDSGMESVEVALSIALIAAIAGFGMLFLGDALANWYGSAGSSLAPGAQMPQQSTSNWVP